MQTGWKWSALFLAATAMAGTCFAQNPEAVKFYKLNFVVKEVDGAKVVNSRAYSMIVSTDKSARPTSVRTGSKVPYQVSNGGGFQYADVGVNIDCYQVRDDGNNLSLAVGADISSMTQEPGTTLQPVIHQNKWNSTVVVPLKKPVMIFSSDDATSKRQMQLELTASPIS
ncbi:MAG: hypothetical protein ABI165_12470 [Bryobacteraceae bacterium]